MNLRDSLPWVNGAPTKPGVYYIEPKESAIGENFKHVPPHVMVVFFCPEHKELAYSVTMGGPGFYALSDTAQNIARHCELVVQRDPFAPTWADIPGHYHYWACDASGMAFYYELCPILSAETGRWQHAKGLTLFDTEITAAPGTVLDWRNSLRKRF